MKSAAAALVRREEKGCFQDLEISWSRSLKNGSFLHSGLEVGPLRNRSSSLEDWDSRGLSGQSIESFLVARESTSTSSEFAASWPLGGKASAKAGPIERRPGQTQTQLDATISNTSSSPKETASRASGLGYKHLCANSTREFLMQSLHFKMPKTASCACEKPIHLTHLLWGSMDIPWHFTARRTEFHYCSHRSANKEEFGESDQNRARNIATEGLIWPLREGREIWGADGAFPNIRRRRKNVEDGIRSISQRIGMILWGFQTIGTPRALPKRLSFTQHWVNLWKRTFFFYTLLFSTFQWSSFKTLQRHLSPAVLYFLSVSLTLSFSFLSYTGDGFVANPSSISSYWLVAVTGQLWKTIACLSLSLSLSERNNLLHEGSVGSQWTLISVAVFNSVSECSESEIKSV